MNTLHKLFVFITKPAYYVAFVVRCFCEAAKEGSESAEHCWLDYPPDNPRKDRR